MKSRLTLYLALLFLGLAIALKMGLFYFDMQHDGGDKITVFVYLLFVLLVSFFSMIGNKQEEDSEKGMFFSDFKAGMRGVALFALFLGAFTYVYYEFIDVEFFQIKRTEAIRLGEETVKYQANNPDKTIEEGLQRPVDMDNIKQSADMFFKSSTHASITTFFFILVGLVYSLFLAMLIRKVPFFKTKV